MKTILSLVLIIAFAFTPAVAQSSLNQKTIDSLMALSFDEFDQNMAGGWRYYADKGDLETASELIKLYLSNHPEIESSHRRVMNFHCGQMLAMMNKNMEAIPYMEASKNTEKDIMQWNIYVDATISFLRKDRDVFDEKISRSCLKNKIAI